MKIVNIIYYIDSILNGNRKKEKNNGAIYVIKIQEIAGKKNENVY
jgi:hypothetical protein